MPVACSEGGVRLSTRNTDMPTFWLSGAGWVLIKLLRMVEKSINISTKVMRVYLLIGHTNITMNGSTVCDWAMSSSGRRFGFKCGWSLDSINRSSTGCGPRDGLIDWLAERDSQS